MGEAKRRRAEIEQFKRAHSDWLASLMPPERETAQLIERAYERIVEGRGLVGGCYLLGFFLRQYLKREKGIETKAVVGWDQRWHVAADELSCVD